MKVSVNTIMYCSPVSDIDIPEITDWKQIKEWFVKWGVLHYTLDKENWKQIDLGQGDDVVDWKTPITTRIYRPSDSGMGWPNDPLDEQET